MDLHTFPVDRADSLEDVTRFRYCSREELLGALKPTADDTVADIGSGTGFYTDEVAPFVGTCYAVDVQPEMHERYREKGLPENVDPVTAEAEALPFDDGQLDGAFSTMTYLEFATAAGLAELRRVLEPGARFVAVDWTSEGRGERGPPLAERFDVDEAIEGLRDAGFDVRVAQSRPETFTVMAES